MTYTERDMARAVCIHMLTTFGLTLAFWPSGLLYVVGVGLLAAYRAKHGWR